MISVKRVVLDILKPHHPKAIEFSETIARVGEDYRVRLTVCEVDEKTETLQVIVEGGAIDMEGIQTAIDSMGGSLHSIDEVEIQSEPDR